MIPQGLPLPATDWRRFAAGLPAPEVEDAEVAS